MLGERKKQRRFYCFASALFIVGMCRLIGIGKYRQFFWNRNQHFNENQHRQKFWNLHIPTKHRKKTTKNFKLFYLTATSNPRPQCFRLQFPASNLTTRSLLPPTLQLQPLRRVGHSRISNRLKPNPKSQFILNSWNRNDNSNYNN